MKERIALLLFSTAVIISCHDKDPGPGVCKPHALLYETDSIVYEYTDGRITGVLYYGSGATLNRDDIAYNSAGQPATVSKFAIAFDGTTRLDTEHTLSYGNDGLPTQLVTASNGFQFVTKFTHNDKSQLELAETTTGKYSLGTTRYEYDDNGNIPKVYYTVNVNGSSKEVLARENLSFDDREKFYSNTPELKVMNTYVYGYLPGRNNCLGSTVYYYNYTQRFASPLSITFVATYNGEGQIESLQSEGTSAQLYSGEVLFKTVVYDCR